MTTIATPRKIQASWRSQPTTEGAGVRLKRAMQHGAGIVDLDPFLLLDDFRSESVEEYIPGFPWHPHRGIETITYVLDGDVEHADSLGNEGVIKSGDVQWMTAGSGIIHQEMPKGTPDGRMYGFQLWANLPGSQKMMDPRYRDVKQAEIPTVTTASGATVRVVAGEVDGVRGPVQDIITDPEYLDVSIPAGGTFTHAVHPEHTVFAYVIGGEGYFEPTPDAIASARERDGAPRPTAFGDGSFVAYEAGGDTVTVTTESSPVRFLLIAGKPLRERVAWYGPVVMNTQAELQTAFRELNEGTFIKHKPAV